jgi:hypothetical protein
MHKKNTGKGLHFLNDVDLVILCFQYLVRAHLENFKVLETALVQKQWSETSEHETCGSRSKQN